jgi:transglutaminase-like putative cysteine protease
MLHRIKHLTEYEYGEPVSSSHHELRLLPRMVFGQRVRSEWLEARPMAAVRRDRIDWFGNRATYLSIHERHTRLVVKTELEVEVSAQLHAEDGTPWEVARDWVRAGASAEARAAIEMILPSPRVTTSPAVRELAAASFQPGRPLMEAARDLMQRIHSQFIYDAAATDVSTPVEDVIRHGRGVCQDFAHLQISCLRSLGLPARYVSGYLATNPDGSAALGADASHAWLSVLLPGRGWLDLDPTNGVVPTDRHIILAYGRDFGDVTPMRGVILGGGRHQLNVAVAVESQPGA